MRGSNPRPSAWEANALPTEPMLRWTRRRVSNPRPWTWQAHALPTELLLEESYFLRYCRIVVVDLFIFKLRPARLSMTIPCDAPRCDAPRCAARLRRMSVFVRAKRSLAMPRVALRRLAGRRISPLSVRCAALLRHTARSRALPGAAVVPSVGFEPTRFWRPLLRRMRLPIPPRRQWSLRQDLNLHAFRRSGLDRPCLPITPRRVGAAPGIRTLNRWFTKPLLWPLS
jgi:hypothetical protein